MIIWETLRKEASGFLGVAFLVRKEWISILVIILLLSGIHSVTGTQTDPQTRTVGPDKQYATIQAAINAANDGDTIVVDPGAYNEHIHITKSVFLYGATHGVSKKDYLVPAGYIYDTATETVIAPVGLGNEPVVEVQNNNIVFDGFIVKRTDSTAFGDPHTHLIELPESSDFDDITIQNNVLGPNTNNPQNGDAGGSAIWIHSHNNQFDGLIIQNNKIIDAKGAGCGILIIGNRFSEDFKFKAAVIHNNTISGNHRAGIEFDGGVRGQNSVHNIQITNNTITNNGWFDTGDKDLLLYGNGITFIRRAVDLSENNPAASQYIDIRYNVITDNEKNGIYFGPINKDITLTNNTIQNNGLGTGGYSKWDGIRIDLDEVFYSPKGSQIYNVLENNIIHYNRLTGNGEYGVRVNKTPTKGSIDAVGNWWGVAYGPKPTGTGDTVSSNVKSIAKNPT